MEHDNLYISDWDKVSNPALKKGLTIGELNQCAKDLEEFVKPPIIIDGKEYYILGNDVPLKDTTLIDEQV